MGGFQGGEKSVHIYLYVTTFKSNNFLNAFIILYYFSILLKRFKDLIMILLLTNFSHKRKDYHRFLIQDITYI